MDEEAEYGKCSCIKKMTRSAVWTKKGVLGLSRPEFVHLAPEGRIVDAEKARSFHLPAVALGQDTHDMIPLGHTDAESIHTFAGGCRPGGALVSEP